MNSFLTGKFVFHLGGSLARSSAGAAGKPSPSSTAETSPIPVWCVDIGTPTALGPRDAVPVAPLVVGWDEANNSQEIIHNLAALPFPEGYEYEPDPIDNLLGGCNFVDYLRQRSAERPSLRPHPVYDPEEVFPVKNRRFWFRRKAFREAPLVECDLGPLFSSVAQEVPSETPVYEDTGVDEDDFELIEKPPGVQSDGLTYFTTTSDPLPTPGLIVGVTSPGVWPSIDRPIPQYGMLSGVTQCNSTVPLPSKPSRIMRAVYRTEGPIFWDSSLPMESITFCSGDFLYGKIEDLDPQNFGYTVKGYVDLRVVSSVVGSGYRHRLGPAVYRCTEVGDRATWVFREILVGARRNCSLPSLQGLEVFERSLTNFVIMPQRARLQVYLDAISGDPRATAKARWDLVIHFTSPLLVAQMRTLRDADLAKETPGADPVLAREQLEAAYAQLLYDRPRNLPLFTN